MTGGIFDRDQGQSGSQTDPVKEDVASFDVIKVRALLVLNRRTPSIKRLQSDFCAQLIAFNGFLAAYRPRMERRRQLTSAVITYFQKRPFTTGRPNTVAWKSPSEAAGLPDHIGGPEDDAVSVTPAVGGRTADKTA